MPDKRKILALVAFLALCLALVACGGDDDGGGEDEQEVKEKAQKLVQREEAPPIPADGRYFAADSPWNTEIGALPTSPDSFRMLSRAKERRAVIEDPDEEGVRIRVRRIDEGLHINTEAWAPLIVEAGDGSGTVETQMVCRQQRCGAGSGLIPESFDLPAGTDPDPRYDGWLTVIDPRTRIGYDFWRARRQSEDVISYQYAKPWTLGGPGFSQPMSVDPGRAVGARGSGLPLFAGVIGPGELESGEINHALAISVPGLARRNYVQPASATDGVGPPNSLPAGARIRLRDTIDIEDELSNDLRGERRRSVEAILVALRRYGAIVVDRAAVPSLYAPKGTPASVLRGNEISFLDLNDFEVMALPPLLKDPPLGQVEQVGIGSVPDSGQAGGAG